PAVARRGAPHPPAPRAARAPDRAAGDARTAEGARALFRVPLGVLRDRLVSGATAGAHRGRGRAAAAREAPEEVPGRSRLPVRAPQPTPARARLVVDAAGYPRAQPPSSGRGRGMSQS